MLHCTFKLGWFLGIATLLMVQLTDGSWQSLKNLHRARRSSDATRLLITGDEDRTLDKHSGNDEYPDEDSLDQDTSIEDPMNLVREQQSRDSEHRRRPQGKTVLSTQRVHWTPELRESFERRPLPLDHDGRDYELELREGQNSSLCNYTVIPIPNPGGRIPRVLEHVKCNHVGARCQELGTYCCIQLYRFVEVEYEGKNSTHKIKVYSGCVCSLQIYGNLEPYTPKLPIDY